MKEREDGHLFYKANKRTHDRFLDSYKLVNLLMEQKEKLLTEVSAEVIKAHISIPLDAEKVYDYDVEQHCRPVPSDVKEPQDKDALQQEEFLFMKVFTKSLNKNCLPAINKSK